MELEGELLDWEVLHNSDSDSNNSTLVNSPELRNLEEIEGDTEGMIRSDYFSLDNQTMYAKEGDVSEGGSVESDNPSWIDPGSETRYGPKNSGEFWSDSGSDRSDDRKFSDFYAKNELGFAENEKPDVGFEGIGEMEAKSGDSGKFSEFNEEKGLGFGDIEVGDSLVSMKFEEGMEKGADFENSGGELGDGSAAEMEGGNPMDERRLYLKSDDEGEKKKVVWWKVPFELLRYCVFKVSPVWSFSVAAAVMGFVILGHRLYKMKRKSRSLHLKVTMDDKKVSQFMTRAARLNEAFSVVRRVPIVRPALPAAGVSSWPVMSLR